MTNAGDQFQRETKYYRGRMPGTTLDWRSQPELYKQYPDAPKVELPPARPLNNCPMHDALRNRKSSRDFTDVAISTQSLSYLLWASTGISRKEHGYEFRAAPSAGALYPIETYLCINSVQAISPGIYHYCVKGHYLELLKPGNCAAEVARAALDQEMCRAAAVVFIWTAIFQRSEWKYGQRAYRYVYLDAGHIAENLALAATSLDLGSCPIAALYDDEVNSIIGADGTQESVVYMTVVGSRAIVREKDGRKNLSSFAGSHSERIAIASAFLSLSENPRLHRRRSLVPPGVTKP
jgi:SagB-type dehydrogenase family enzyme